MLKRETIIVWFLFLCIVLTSCLSQDPSVPMFETTMVRLYEVIPVPEHLDAHGQYQYKYPVVRAGLEYGISMSTEDKASFASAIDALESRSGIEIEHVILGSWKQLRKELEKNRGDGTTKLVIFDNSYDQSLIKEAMNGGYFDFASLMEETGIYENKEYQQAVLQAGQIGSQQLLVPILYNVAGVSFTSKNYTSEAISYEQLYSKIQTAMDDRTGDFQLSVISKAMLDDINPDLFLNAAGQPWAGYERQQEFFNLLYEHVTNYNYDESGLKKTWSIYIDQLDDELQSQKETVFPTEISLTQDEMFSVGLDPDVTDELYAPNNLWYRLYSNSSYYVEYTGVETEPYHSVVGMITVASDYYGGEYRSWTPIGDEGAAVSTDFHSHFAYLPIQMYTEEGYAAQPFCYVAAVDDGDEVAAFKVIQEMMKQPFSLQFGFSVYEPAWRDRFEVWKINSSNFQFERSGRRVYYNEIQGEWIEEPGINLFSYGLLLEDAERYAQVGETLTMQLDNIQYAQIADREVISIWQDTLADCVSSNLSAEVGFKMLCERMDVFYE